MSVELKSVRFIFSAEPSLLARVDNWRRKQADLPSRAEAVRRLLERALKDE
jgi:metal-responsive CopG/Arc/MetJ family transcriptional regulator